MNAIFNIIVIFKLFTSSTTTLNIIQHFKNKILLKEFVSASFTPPLLTAFKIQWAIFVMNLLMARGFVNHCTFITQPGTLIP